MKAAVMFRKGEMPRYTDIDEPVAPKEDQVLVRVKAAALKNIDKSIAHGNHYSSSEIEKPRIIGGDGIGLLEDGTRIFAFNNGMMAEKALVDKNRIISVPEGLDDCLAAALPNAVAGSAMALRFRAGLQKGETVLINGATGFTGKIAVQIARHYGAGKIIATGRNEQSLQKLLSLGADEILPLNQSDENLIAQIKAIQTLSPIDVVIDYLWGHTAERLLTALKGDGSPTHRMRFISVGAITGNNIQLSSEILRSIDLTISGSGLGSWTKKQMQELFTVIIPEMFQLAVENRLTAHTVPINLKDIEKVWNMNIRDGARLVVLI